LIRISEESGPFDHRRAQETDFVLIAVNETALAAPHNPSIRQRELIEKPGVSIARVAATRSQQMEHIMKRIVVTALTTVLIAVPLVAMAQTPPKKPVGPGQSEYAPGQQPNPKKAAPGQIQKNTNETAKENAPGQQPKTKNK
jgi:hypothetical protein